MRVPSIGLPLDERLIVREGYRLAERMMRNYEDKPGLGDVLASAWRQTRRAFSTLFRTLT